jgi:hypothetical protein
MAEFNLAAAIGATGETPNYEKMLSNWQKSRVPQGPDAADKAHLRDLYKMVTIDKTAYHPVYQQQIVKATADFYDTYRNARASNADDVVEQVQSAFEKWNQIADNAKLKSPDLFALQKKAEGGAKAGLFVSPSEKFAAQILTKSNSPEAFYENLLLNKDALEDGYFNFDPQNQTILTPTHPIIDYDRELKSILSSKKLTIGEQQIKSPDGKTITTQSVQGLPLDREDARKLRNYYLDKTGEDPGEEYKLNAYDVGKESYWTTDPMIKQQFRATHPEFKTLSDDALYNEFYKQHVIPNTPMVEKSATLYTGPRTSVYVNNALTDEPGTFQGSATTFTYANGKTINSKRTTALSKDAEGVAVQWAANQYAVDKATGLPAFDTNDTGNYNFKIANVMVLPCIKAKDASGRIYWKPLDATSEAEVQANGELAKGLRYLPFAEATIQELNISALPTVGGKNILMPLYEDGVVKKVTDSNDQGSALLGALFTNRKLNDKESANWRLEWKRMAKLFK